jgi:regulator of RNase E activity RraA
MERRAEVLGRASVSTALLSIALDRCGIRGQCQGILPLDRRSRTYGPAFTVRIVPQSSPPLGHDEYMDDLKAGDVCAMDARGPLAGSVWGDLRSLVASRRGVAGTVIDGTAGDTSACIDLAYPVFVRAATMLGGGGRVRIEAKQVPVVIGGVYVCPGDVIFGDADGVIVIPQGREQEVLDVADALDRADENIRNGILGGMSLVEARRRFGVPAGKPPKSGV